ncbi:hypothetical protein BGZ95_006523 [Linnemannia exigua]|uniref:Endothelin-converting enzyme 1 n=1 Tax=Linnemannia exigua TaxID=604196 RepID=A0AAD4H883_9FUNG|nr:hypothetical protein BGZ95_006523 [Linnemannia exigua]
MPEIIHAILDPSLGKAPKTTPGDIADQNNLKKLQDFFASCMNEDAILRAGRKLLMDEVQKIIQAFPASGLRADKTILSKTLSQIVQLGLGTSGLLGIYAGTSPADPRIRVLNINEDGLGLGSSEKYQDGEMTGVYRSTVAFMFQIILGDEDVGNRTQPLRLTDIKQEWLDAAKDIVNFEIQLAAIATPAADLYDPVKSINTRTIEELAAMTPSINWSLLIQELLPAGVKNTHPILVSSPSYLTRLDTLLQNTTPKILQRYFTWIVIQGLSSHVAEPYQQPLIYLRSVRTGGSTGVTTERWKTCVATVNKNMGQLVGHYFVQETFKGNSRKDVMTIVDNILDSYSKNFPTIEWLDQTTRDGAIKKLEAIARLVGYSTSSPDVASTKSLEDYYKDLVIASDDYFGNQLRSSTWSTKGNFESLPFPVDRNSMPLVPQTVNAYYSPTTNTINFPAGILQPPFFHADNPEYINYGSMGVVGGHEIGHAFDNTGRKYDSLGRLANWWTNATSQAFEDKAQCYVNQYSNFTFKGPDGKDYNVDGQRTLGENLADNGGIKMAFHIWQNRVKSDPYGRKFKNFKLPGLDKYTPEQLFFVSYGRFWCNKMRPEALVHMVLNENHSPAKWRINGVAQNSPDFAKAFSCPAGSPMNPATKCEVW